MITERALDILRAIVHDYVESREPVGSQMLVARHGFDVSAATIRNDMALLESEELIVAPHTSSGRIPTDKGYRVYVDTFVKLRPLTVAQRRAIDTFLAESRSVDSMLEQSVRALSLLTNQLALIQYPAISVSVIRRVEFVRLGDFRVLSVVISESGRVDQRLIELTEAADDSFVNELRQQIAEPLAGLRVPQALQILEAREEAAPPGSHARVAAAITVVREQLLADQSERVVLSGAANLAKTELDFSRTIAPILEVVEEQAELLRLVREMRSDERAVATSIGRENFDELHEASIVSGEYITADGGVGRLALIGPTRMNYSGNMTAVRAVARYLSRSLRPDH